VALADGSFDLLFQQYFGEIIKRSNLEGRTVLELVNPLLPPETPLQRKALWYRPSASVVKRP
jgi:hypothetical protein